MGFLGRSRRSADVIAVTPMRVLVLNQAFLNRSIRHQPDAAALLLHNLSMVLAERLAQTSDRLWQLSQST
jgi:CRP-like cAMP-binding protein